MENQKKYKSVHFNMTNRIETFLIYSILTMLMLIPSLQKLSNGFMPDWFIKKFSNSILAIFPFSLELSFIIIVGLELFIGLLFFYQIVRLYIDKSYFSKITNLNLMNFSFNLYLIIFIILFFGSFLVKDYDNGFKDFMYFIGIIYIKNYLNQKFTIEN